MFQTRIQIRVFLTVTSKTFKITPFLSLFFLENFLFLKFHRKLFAFFKFSKLIFNFNMTVLRRIE